LPRGVEPACARSDKASAMSLSVGTSFHVETPTREPSESTRDIGEQRRRTSWPVRSSAAPSRSMSDRFVARSAVASVRRASVDLLSRAASRAARAARVFSDASAPGAGARRIHAETGRFAEEPIAELNVTAVAVYMLATCTCPKNGGVKRSVEAFAWLLVTSALAFGNGMVLFSLGVINVWRRCAIDEWGDHDCLLGQVCVEILQSTGNTYTRPLCNDCYYLAGEGGAWAHRLPPGVSHKELGPPSSALT
jgi:hypothetical protein